MLYIAIIESTAMRRLLELLVSLLLVFVWVLLSSGEPVDLDIAAKLGETHLRSAEQSWNSGSSALQSSTIGGWDYSVSEVRELRDNGRLLAYVLDLEPTGCIVVSTDTDVHPVIAYTPAGRFSTVDASENIFLHLVKWDMQNRLDALPVIPLELKEENNALWERYLSEKDGASLQAATASQVWGPWVETTWSQGVAHRNQGYVYPTYSFGDYNRYCPIGHSSEWRSLAGCGAVALAQIVNYWEYPSSISFDQDDSYTTSMSYSINGTPYNLTANIDADSAAHDFPDFAELNSKLSTIRYYDGDLYSWDPNIWNYRSPVEEDPNLDAATKQEIKEDIAALNFACGIVFQSTYSPVGTSSGISYSPGGTMNFPPLKDRLDYSSATTADITWPQFYASLEENMEDARPAMILIDSQSNSQPHFIVVDGYRDEWQGGSAGYYHLNFGWGDFNPDSVADSWYNLPAGMPQPGGLEQYSVVKLGVINIYPPPQGNTPPVASNLSIDPLSPDTGDDLNASYDYYDANGDPQSGSEIRWYKNGDEQAAYYGLTTVSAADTSKGENWNFSVRPSDGEDFGTLQTSSAVTIGNTPPVASNLDIDPPSPYTDDDLNASYDFNDADGDPQSGSEIRWYKNGDEQVAYFGLTIVSSADTSKGESWSFSVKPRDGTDFGTLQTSSSVTIGNTPPVASNLDIEPSSPDTGDALDASYDYYDADGDSQSGSEIRWYKGVDEQAAYFGLTTVSSTDTSKGENWSFSVKPRDGTDFEALQTSSTVTIGNTPPVASNLDIDPPSPGPDDDLFASYDFSDANGDSNSGSEIRWYRNGDEQIEYYGLGTVSAADTSGGDVWNFTVRPSDGEDFGTLHTSSTVIVSNTPPVASNLSIEPPSPGLDDDLVGSYDYYDADGDLQSGSEIRWYRNGDEQIAYYGLGAVSAADTSDGDVWYFTVRPSDGEDFGDTRTSNSVIIGDQIMQVEMPLYPGLNFISVCLDIENTDLLWVLDQIKDSCISVYYYDAASGQWKKYIFDGPQFLNDLYTIEPGKGYWLNMTTSAVLTITGPQIADTAVQLFPGQNLVGYSLMSPKSCAEALATIDGDYVVIWTFDNETGTWRKYAPADPNAANTLTQLEPGKAYCIEASIVCFWDASP